MQPHTVTDKARTCEDCHNSHKALGLGTGTYVSMGNGLDIGFELERIVDEDGNQIQTTNHVGARPFTRYEMDRIIMEPDCAQCHGG